MSVGWQMNSPGSDNPNTINESMYRSSLMSLVSFILLIPLGERGAPFIVFHQYVWSSTKYCSGSH